MASPLGHALTGLAWHVASARDQGELRSATRGLALVALAVAADLDLLARLVDGRNHHQGASHSVGAAVAVGLLAALAAMWRRWPRPARVGCLAGGAWLLHGLMDFASRDTNPPLGPMLLWPLSGRHWISPAALFFDTARTLTWAAVRTNILAVAWELLVLVPVLLTVLHWKRRRLRASSAS